LDFRINADQEALQQGVRRFCEGRIAIDRLRELEEKEAFDRSLWDDLAEMGIFQLRMPETAGGLGLSSADAVLVFEELGRSLAPGPLVWSHLAAPWIEGAGAGEVVVGGLDLISAAPRPYLVEYWAHLDVLLLLRPEGLFRVDPKTLDAQPIATPLDPLTPMHHVTSLPRGERLAESDVARQLWLEGAALVSGQLLGIAEAALERALDYAKKREQFGQVIGSFQAIKHLCADMFVRQEVARAGAYAAGATLDHPEVGDLERAVGSGKITAGDAAMKNARACIQIHGGMGYTWEVPAHYFLKRTWVLESIFGTGDEHADRIALRIESGT
jgi:alkylation response protein AidB-like acyl-CoA dehydrogenase